MSERHPVLVVDFGAQYAQLIARRVREAHVYSEIVSHNITAEEVRARGAAAIIFSGGPASVNVEGSPRIDPAIYDTGVPIFGICYGAQLLALQLGGEVAKTDQGEYGRTVLNTVGGTSALMHDLPDEQDVWMSHFDTITRAPDGFTVVASTPNTPAAAFEDLDRRICGVQFHPEVKHTPKGQDILQHFLYNVAGCLPEWTPANVIEEQVAAIRAQVGDRKVLCGLSGGVDSAVAAALVYKAVGDQLTCAYVDIGLMRHGESDQVEKTFRDQFKVDLVHVKAGDRFMEALNDVNDPEKKRKIIGELFIRVFEEVKADHHDADFLVQGTLYPDVIESGSSTAANIKSHHNVGGLPDDMEFELVEPLRDLFKDEVRAVGEQLGLPPDIVWRQPFPGPGLAVRIVGTITPERVEILRNADRIVTEEIKKAGLERELWQAFAVLLAVKSVGVMGDERTYEYPICIRAVMSDDAMTADWARLPYELLELLSSRIINEVPGVNRVVYDITSKPPGTIEWEQPSMEFTLPADVVALGEEAREVGLKAAAARPYREDAWITGFDREFSLDLGRRGWLGMTWPVELGGGGLSALERFVVTEALIATGAPLAATWMGDRQIGPTIVKYGTAEQQARYLPPLIEGSVTWAIGLSEPDAGSDVANIRTRATLDGDEYVVNGQKIWTSSAAVADHIYLIARTGEGGRGHSGMSEFIVDMKLPGVTVAPITDPTREDHFYEVYFENVRVPADRLVGTAGESFKQVMGQLEHERAGIDRLVSNHALFLDARDAADTSSRVVRDEIARLETDYIIGRMLVLKGVVGQAPAGFSAVTKTFCTEHEQRVANFASRVFGAQTMLEGRLSRAVLYAPAYTIQGGTTNVLRNIVAERLLGMPKG